MTQFRFEDLSNSINTLSLKLDRIERLLIDKIIAENLEKNDFLVIEDAAKLLKLSVATVYTKVSKNEIPVNKRGKRLYFARAELLDWIKLGRVKTINEIQREVETKFNSKKFV